VLISGRSALQDPASRYAHRYAPVTPRRYRAFDEQEPASGEGGESERFIACDIQAGSHRLWQHCQGSVSYRSRGLFHRGLYRLSGTDGEAFA
jgi:hypothetical protein